MNLFSESISPLLTVSKLDVLKNHKINTTLDFVQCNNDKMASLIGCNVSEIIKIKDSVLAAHNSKAIRADKWCDMRLHTSSVVIESGIKIIDKLLGGAIQSGRLTELYGDSCSGKTQFAFQLSANASLNSWAVCFLTSGEANPKQILKFMHRLKKDGDYVNELQRITFTSVTDVYQLLEILWTAEMSKYKLVIIDSLATLFLPILGDSFNDAISLLNKVASDLKRLAVVHRCAVLIINHVSRWTKSSDATTKAAPPPPSLGRYWLSVPNVRIYSNRISNNEFELTIVRNVYCPKQSAKCSVSYFANDNNTEL